MPDDAADTSAGRASGHPSGEPGLRLPAIDPGAQPMEPGCDYPAPFRAAVEARRSVALGDLLGLTHFGVRLCRLPPGTLSSQRHWHSHEDEFVYILEGEVELVTDAGRQTLTPGMCAGFPAGRADGHHLVNRSERDALFLCVGDRRPGEDAVEYPDIDLSGRFVDGEWVYFRKDGSRW